MSRANQARRVHRLLANPCALGGAPTELLVGGLCALFLLAVFLVEVATPNAVVASFALVPLLAGAWVLSTRFAAVLIGLSGLLFALAILAESTNRLSLLLVGIPTIATAVVVRMYAVSLATLLLTHPYARHNSIHQSFGPTLDKVAGFSYGIDSLTRRELEVARLAAKAYTASEIAGQLHIGERTVESHLASTYSKLGINSRSELIRIASQLDAG
jgi:DNA-binding CsgD family transcriptional regulator